MLKIPQGIETDICKLVFKRQILKTTTRLSTSKNELINSLLLALNSTFSPDYSEEENNIIQKIESIRNRMNSSNETIQVTDFGAGCDNVITDNEDTNGIVIERKICDVSRKSSKPLFWAQFLFNLIKEFKPDVCLELGTCLGISGAYQAAALKLNKRGILVTIEGSDSLAEISRQNFLELGMTNVSLNTGKFSDILENVLEQNHPVDYAFIDGHHQKEAQEKYFDIIYPYLSKNSIVIFDDINWSKGMKLAWKNITEDERVHFSLSLYQLGICLIDESIKEKQNIKIGLL